MPDTSQRQHLHLDDYPVALGVLRVLFEHRLESAAEIGYEPTEHGAWVDWESLEHSWLSSTETAAVVVARGLAMAERQGGFAQRLQQVLVDALTNTPPRRARTRTDESCPSPRPGS